MKRPEAIRTGIYALLGPDSEREGGLLAYVGEADDIAKRMRIHRGTEAKDFADRFAFVVSADTNLIKAHVRYLEVSARVLGSVRAAAQEGAAQLQGSSAP